MTSRATAREAVSEPDVLIWTSKGRIQASKLVNLEHKWLEEDDTFMIKVDGEWVEAQSIDFNFK